MLSRTFGPAAAGTLLALALLAAPVAAPAASAEELKVGARVSVSYPKNKLNLFAAATGERL